MWRALPLSFLPAWAQPWSVIWWQALLIYDIKVFFSKKNFRSAWPPFLFWWITSHRYQWRRRTWSHGRLSSLWAPWHSVSVPRWCLLVYQTYTSTLQFDIQATGLPPPFPSPLGDWFCDWDFLILPWVSNYFGFLIGLSVLWIFNILLLSMFNIPCFSEFPDLGRFVLWTLPKTSRPALFWPQRWYFSLLVKCFA